MLAHVPLAKVNCMAYRRVSEGAASTRAEIPGGGGHWSSTGFLGSLGCCHDSYRYNERPGLMVSEVPPSQLLYAVIQEDE